jgi:hypothetical protein
MTIETMKLALEAWDTGLDKRPAMEALRTAIAEAEKQEPVAWRNAAIRLGEELSSVGPNGYYNMTAEQWLDWAMDQQPQGKNSLTTPPAAQPEQKQDSTCNKTLRAEGKGYPRTCRKCGKGPCIADRVQPEQGQWDAIPDAFNEWWDADYDDSTNPFRLNSPAYWAWSGWSAANKKKNT